LKHAYLILAHGNWDLLKLLISAIDDERNDIYVHIDAKVKILPALTTSRSILCVLQNRVKVYWGDVSVVEAEYALFQAAYSQGGYSYYHVLSGSDLPLKSQDYIHYLLDNSNGSQFIGYTSTQMSPEIIRKVRRWHLFPHSFKRRCPIRAIFLRIQEDLGIIRNNSQEFQKGTQWISITPELVSLILSRKEWALKTFSHTFCADEIFVQTICWNSPLRKNIHNTEDDAAGCLRAIGWRNGCLYDWCAEDLQTLKNSDALFARKFNLKDKAFLQEVLKLSKALHPNVTDL